MGCDLEHFVVETDQQCREDEQARMGGVGIVVGKSGVAVVHIGWMTLEACGAPCHPATHPPVASSPSALSTASSFQSVVNDQSGGAQGSTRPEKGEECIRPPCNLLSHPYPMRVGHFDHSNCCHFHCALKEVPVEHVKTVA